IRQGLSHTATAGPIQEGQALKPSQLSRLSLAQAGCSSSVLYQDSTFSVSSRKNSEAVEPPKRLIVLIRAALPSSTNSKRLNWLSGRHRRLAMSKTILKQLPLMRRLAS